MATVKLGISDTEMGKIEKGCRANVIKEMVGLKHDQLMDHLEKEANNGQLFTMNY